MSELIPFKRGQIAKVFQGMDAGPALGEHIQTGGFSSVRYRGKRWSLQHAGHNYPFVRPDDGSPLTFLDLIVIAQQPNVSKAYFPGDFDEDSASGPVCTSVRGDKPDPGVSVKQSETCASCKHFGWTTLPNGRRGKECQDHIRLAVFLLPALTKKMLGSPLDEPVFFKVPPGSFPVFKAYGAELKDEGYPPYSVVTRVSFHADKLFQIEFKGVKILSDEEAAVVKRIMDEKHAVIQRIIGEDTLIPVTQTVKPKIEQVDTGLLEAYGGKAEEQPQANKKQTVVKPKTAAKVVEEVVQESTETFDYEAADAGTDKKVEDVLKQSVNDMFN